MTRSESRRQCQVAGRLLTIVAGCLLSGCHTKLDAGSGASSNAGPHVGGRIDSVDPKVLEQMNAYEKKIVALGGRPQLHLDFSQSNLTDEDLANLEVLPMVTSIDLSYTRITDKGIAQLKKYPQLERLTIVSVPITDAAIPDLKAIGKLWKVDFDQLQMSREGRLELVKFLSPRANAHVAASKFRAGRN